MALLWIDGFDHYSAAQSNRMYEDGAMFNMSTSIARTGQGANPHYLDFGVKKYLGTNARTLIVGFAHYNDNDTYQSWSWLVRFYDGTTEQCRLERGSEGKLRLYGNNTLLAESPAVTYRGKQWCYIEIKITFGNPGSYEIRVNTRTVMSGTGRTTSTDNNYANWVGWHGQNGDWIDDLYICDDTGTQNNDFLGDIKVVTILPNADGSNTGWTPSSGTSHYSLVNETPANDDTNYLYTSTVGATDTENFQDITLTGSIRGILQLACIRKDDAGARSACLVCRVGTTDYEGPEVSLGTSYTYLKQIRETNPATGAPWTVADINAAQFGVRMKS